MTKTALNTMLGTLRLSAESRRLDRAPCVKAFTMTKIARNAMYLNTCGNIRRLILLCMLEIRALDVAHHHQYCRTRGAN